MMNTTAKVLLLALWSFGLILSSTQASSYTTTIDPKEEECFEFRSPSDKAIVVTGSYEVLDDDMEEGKLGVSISNLDNGDMLYRSPSRVLEGNFELKILNAKTRLSLCFENRYEYDPEDDNSFDLGFAIRITNPPRALDDGVIGPDAERALMLVEKAAEIHKDWELMKDHQEFTRNREAIHAEMSETILGRLVRWAFFETFLVVGMAVAQVMYWKRFFETRRYL